MKHSHLLAHVLTDEDSIDSINTMKKLVERFPKEAESN